MKTRSPSLPSPAAAGLATTAAGLMLVAAYWFGLREVPPLIRAPRTVVIPLRPMGTGALEISPGDRVFDIDALGWVNGPPPPNMGAGQVVLLDIFDDY